MYNETKDFNWFYDVVYFSQIIRDIVPHKPQIYRTSKLYTIFTCLIWHWTYKKLPRSKVNIIRLKAWHLARCLYDIIFFVDTNKYYHVLFIKAYFWLQSLTNFKVNFFSMCQLNNNCFRQQSQSGDTQINVQKQPGLFKCVNRDEFYQLLCC